jgi:hypothetical protein
MNKKFIITAFVFFSFFTPFNQILASDNDSIKSNWGISVSYWGTAIFNNGIIIGLEKKMFQSEKYTIVNSLSLCSIRRTDIYTSAGLRFGSDLRRTYQWGLYIEHGIRFGYLGTYYDIDIYKINSDGEIVNIGRKWENSIVLGYSLGFGYDFSKVSKLNMKAFVKPNIYYKFPNNDDPFYFNNYSIEIGLIVYPKFKFIR